MGDAQLQVCVVCGHRSVEGKERKSGFKCPKCVGKSSTKVNRYLACKAVEYREVFRRGGFGHLQPVEWSDKGRMVTGRVILDTCTEKWTDPSSDAPIPLQSDAGDFLEKPAAQVFPLVLTEVVFRDGKRGGHRIHLEACEGFLRHSYCLKAKEAGDKEYTMEVRKLNYSFDGPATLSFPELEVTKAKTWIPMNEGGWRSHKAIVWHLRQIATAAGIEHDLPLNPPQPRFNTEPDMSNHIGP
eukprot:TRINITY_DN21266_c0_g1_i1.p1 TRINITY_DN21266_c0_g1~~TRINITY_DN21266_c0_g1_i1.p1  ORF type:complete len:241 (+),score=90.83 TRINITY_DN21266_c0_g1_i1:109-831(+)